VQIGIGELKVGLASEASGICLYYKAAAVVLGIEAFRRSVTDLELEGPIRCRSNCRITPT
jgi:hypothetical protein